jgi:hypothetical protein
MLIYFPVINFFCNLRQSSATISVKSQYDALLTYAAIHCYVACSTNYIILNFLHTAPELEKR